MATMNKREHKKFKVDDKVFAKLRGYPPWPAIITNKKNTYRYDVVFYGTGEVGSIKLQDLFYYLQHKSTLIKKSQKRKVYNNAIEEIEKAIEEAGTDGNDGSWTTNINNNNIKPTKYKKRASVSVSDWQSKKRKSWYKTPCSSKTTVNNSQVRKREKYGGKKITGKDITYNLSDIRILTTEFLQQLVAYAEFVARKKDLYKDMPVEKREKNKIEMLIMKHPGGKLIGIKFNYSAIPFFNNEYEYAQYEGTRANTILSYKTLIERGSFQPENEPHIFVTNLNFDEIDALEAVELDLIQHEVQKRSWLRTENNLVDIHTKIKKTLELDKADSKKILEYLEEMIDSKIEPLMLKKHPDVVETVNQLCTYTVDEERSDLTIDDDAYFDGDDYDDDLQTFAYEIRIKATALFRTFANLFDVGETAFWNIFLNLVRTFRQQLKHLPKECVGVLTAEPYSRQTILDRIIIYSNTKEDTENKYSGDTINSEKNDEVVKTRF